MHNNILPAVLECEGAALRLHQYHRAIDELIGLEPKLGEQFSRAAMVQHLSSWLIRMKVVGGAEHLQRRSDD